MKLLCCETVKVLATWGILQEGEFCCVLLTRITQCSPFRIGNARLAEVRELLHTRRAAFE